MASIKEIKAIEAKEVLYTKSRKTSDIFHAAQTADGQIVPVQVYFKSAQAAVDNDTTDVVYGQIIFSEDSPTTTKEG